MIYAVQYSTSSLSATPVFQGATPYVLPTDTKFVSSLPAISNRIPGLNVYVDGLGPGAVGTPILKGYLYSATTGNLFAQTTPVVVLDGQTARWVNLPFATPAQLPGGSAVNVVLQTGGANNVARIWGSSFATPQTYINLVPDPSFENSPASTYWTRWLGLTSITSTPMQSYYGANSLHMVPNCATSYIGVYTEFIPVAGKTYSASFAFRAPFTDQYFMDVRDGPMTWFRSSDQGAITVTANTWQTFTFKNFVPTASTKLVFVMQKGSVWAATPVYIDGMMVVEGPTAATPPAYFDGSMPGSEWLGVPHKSASVQLATPVKVNYASYSDMDMAAADTYWMVWQGPQGGRTAATGMSLDTTTFKTGTQSLKYVPDQTGGFYFYRHDANQVPAYVVKPGQVWSVSAWYKGPAGRQFLIGARQYSGGVMTTDVFSGAKTLTGNWDRFSYTYTVPASGATSFSLISVTAGTIGIGESFWFDAPQIELATPLTEYFDGDTAGYKWIPNSYSGLSISTTDYQPISKLPYPYAATPAYALELGQATPNLGRTTGISW